MALRLGDIAPDFIAQTTESTIKFHEWLGASWGILFSHPRDFTPVCTTELDAVAKLKKEFNKRSVKIIAISVDPISDHKTWIVDINETQKMEVNFPLIADPERIIAIKYDPSQCNRAKFLLVVAVVVNTECQSQLLVNTRK